MEVYASKSASSMSEEDNAVGDNRNDGDDFDMESDHFIPIIQQTIDSMQVEYDSTAESEQDAKETTPKLSDVMEQIKIEYASLSNFASCVHMTTVNKNLHDQLKMFSLSLFKGSDIAMLCDSTKSNY
eukprot:5635389-Ditylum_brightwellii.AAC.1